MSCRVLNARSAVQTGLINDSCSEVRGLSEALGPTAGWQQVEAGPRVHPEKTSLIATANGERIRKI